MKTTSEETKPKFLSLPNTKGIFKQQEQPIKKPTKIKLGIRLTDRIMFANVSV